MNNFSPLEPKIALSHPGALPIALSLTRICGIRKLLEEKSGWTPSSDSISPGILAETLVSALLCGCRPIYKVERFFHRNRYVNIFYKNDKINHSQLNDDAYARMLDTISTLDGQLLFESTCLHMLQYHGLDITVTHSDTTSISVEGVYAPEETVLPSPEENKPPTKPPCEELFSITYGHSKDRRPDLKQFKFGLSVQENGLPISGELLSGNTSDKNWTPDAVDVLSTMLSENGYKDTLFLADSAVISTQSLHNFVRNDIQFISRFPETFKLAKELKGEAWEKNEWEDIGALAENQKDAAHYKTWKVEREIEGETFDFVVVHSSKLAERKERTLLQKIETLQKGFEKQSKDVAKKDFSCEADAEKEAVRLQKSVEEKGFHSELKVHQIVKMKYAHKGRPKKGEEPTKEIAWKVELKIGTMKEEVYERKRREEATFVLVCRIKEEMGSAGILKKYKNQDKVEQGFRFLKMPQYLGAIYTKLPSRVKSLGYIFLIVLLLAKYLEYRVRIGMRRFKGVLKIGGQKVLSPSAKTILELLSEILVYDINGERKLAPNIIEDVLEIIKWSGFDENVYINGCVNDRFMSG